MGKKLFWSRDRLVKHEFDCLGLGLGLGLWIASGLSVKQKSVKQKFRFYAIYYRINKFTINQFDILIQCVVWLSLSK